jgi:hypothetical protein
MSNENETLRWPANLDHDAIVQRLVQVRESARAAGIEELAARLIDVETIPAVLLGARVIGALTWIQDKPQCQAYATPLGIVAMNLKNLK